MDPLTRLLVSATFGISIALNTVDGGSILNLTLNSTTIPPLFFTLLVVFILADLVLLLHLLLFETFFTRGLATSSTVLVFSLLLLATIFNFPMNYKILTSVQFVLQLPVPILLFNDV